jgi:hypothetical protein
MLLARITKLSLILKNEIDYQLVIESMIMRPNR